MNKLLSVIIPVYNTEKYLKKCLDSVLTALPENSEILIINDGSTDNSEEIILKYKEKHPEIIEYYKKDNGGLSDTKNYGLARAKGEYISVIDSDDWIDPNMYADIMKKMKKENAAVGICDMETVYEDGHAEYQHCVNYDRKDKILRVLDTPLVASSCNKVIKKSLYEGLQFPTGLNNEDVAVTPYILAIANNIVHIPSAHYKYFQRSGSIQNRKFDKRRFSIIETADLCFKYAQNLETSKLEKLKGTIYIHQILAILFYLIKDVKGKERKELIKEYITLLNSKFNDIYTNKYVKEYIDNSPRLERIYKSTVIKAIKENNSNKINRYFSYLKIGKIIKNFI